MVKKLVTRAEFARKAGVSGAAVTKACAGVLIDALDGKRIDLCHPSSVAYLEEKARIKMSAPATGLDPLYEEAVDWCIDQGNYAVSALKSHLKIGHARASKIIETMRVNGIAPDKSSNKELSSPPSAPKPHVRGTAAAKERKKSEPTPEMAGLPCEVEELLDWPLGELISKFGTDTRFVDWLSATQKIEAINEKRLKNAQTKGELVRREIVQNGVIDTFNSAHLRIMKDGAKSIAAGAIAKHASGAELSEIEAYISDILGSFIRPVKSKVARALKNA